MKSWICFYLSFVSISMFAQPMLSDIEMDKIPQRKVRAFLDKQIENSKIFFSDMEPSCKNNRDLNAYNKVEHVFHVNSDIHTVWDAYKNSSMAEAWNSKNVSFGVLFSKWGDMVLYNNDIDYSDGVDTAQVFFLNLKIFKGVYNLAVGMEIVEVDSVKNEIQFSYLEGGKSEGAQTIKLVELEDGSTQIIHSSVFRSASHFRDRRIYPYFHERLIMEFHENILRKALSDQLAFVLLNKQYQLN